jgi:hypothetical protein
MAKHMFTNVRHVLNITSDTRRVTDMDIMLNLKTWGNTPGCDIRSIGACVFDPQVGSVPAWDEDDHCQTQPDKVFYIACDNPVQTVDGGEYGEFVMGSKYPLTRDPQTVQWWSEQSDEAQAAFADPVDLREALKRFTSWLVNLMPEAPTGDYLTNLRLWSHGSHFDPPILAAAYAACGLSVPWHYRAPRDTRTIFDAAGIADHSAWLAEHPGPLGVAHHALDDAICQARAVCGAMAGIKEWRDIAEHVRYD